MSLPAFNIPVRVWSKVLSPEMERDPVLGKSSPGNCVPYYHIKGPWTGKSTLLLIPALVTDVEKQLEDDVGKAKIPGKA